MSAILTASAQITIPFHDLDPMGVCWHGHYVKYLELARGELMRRIDYDYPQMLESGYYWPVIDLNIRYVKILAYGQVIDVQAALVEYENYLKVKYLITDAKTGQKITKATTTQVAVEKDSMAMQLVCPPVLRDKLAGLLS